ncbi:hypothetical protein [Arenibacter echinorum]|nr:hypothetical protein [Arenibacter echinorum]
MRFKVSFFISFVALTYNIYGQDPVPAPLLSGEVSFVTTQNVYVKFHDTQAIIIGDSLRLEGTGNSCLVIKNKSTTSCVCTVVEGCTIQKGDVVIYRIPPKIPEKKKETPRKEVIQPIIELEEKPLYKETIRGSVSAASYNTINSQRDDRHRLVGRLSMNAEHIKGSKFSLNTYLNYQHILGLKDTSSYLKNSLLRIYNLAAHYDATPTLSLTLGRNINSKISSLGAIDGLQVEKFFGKQYFGAIAGFRPDILDFGFNSNLLQYGGYVGTLTEGASLYSQTTLGFIQQQNSGEIDRRYAYFQHTSTIFQNLNLFSSLEMDLYSKLNEVVSNNIRLTNLYLSARYRFSRKFNMMVSYDSRKRILYYETFQTEVERLLDDDVARQGARARINFRPFKNIFAGASYSKRFQNNSENRSDNIYGFITLSKLPTIGGRLSLSYNMNESNYLKSNVAAIRHSNSYLDGRLNADFYYRFVHYHYTNNLNPLSQHYVGTNLSYYIDRKLMFSISGEMTTYDQENNYRIYSRLVQRF